MIDQFERNLEKYAEVIVRVGLNVQPGQRLLIGAPFLGVDGTPLEAYPLVRQIARAAYQAGATYVGVNWDDEALQRMRVQHAPADTMDLSATWKNDIALEYINNGDAFLRIYAPNADLMAGLDPASVQAKQKTEAQQYHKLRTPLGLGAANYLIASAATTSWAAKVFPDLAPDAAATRLWDAIFAACRVHDDDPVTAWTRHLAELGARTSSLNSRKFSALHYTGPGTDLTVGLPEGHVWHTAGMTTKSGIGFVANIPTEEVYTLPHKDRIDGVVASTMPLSYGSSLIDDFTLKFTGGRVVEASARTGQDALDNLLNTDAQARALGEVALVPHSSPISQVDHIFLNLLFDENASNHLALGNAYRNTMDGGGDMTADEFAAAGGNESLAHVDFMIGSGAMDVDGVTADGTTEPVMRQGEWAFDA